MVNSEQSKTEQKILKAAYSIFLNKGLDGARMQDIADEAGINKSLLHYYFRSKDKLFIVVLRQVFNKVFPNLFQIFTEQEPLNTKIRKFFDVYLDFLMDNPQIPNFFLGEISRRPELLQELFTAPVEFGLLDKVQHLIDSSVLRGEMKAMSAEHFILNLVSLCIFPFVVRPVIRTVFAITDEDYDELIKERKKVTAEFFINAIT